MNGLAHAGLALAALALTGCPEEQPPPGHELHRRATQILATSITPYLRSDQSFTVTLNGAGVVSAFFGPRQVSKYVGPGESQAIFFAREFPEGTADLALRIQGQMQQRTVGNVTFDFTPPELVRVEGTRLGQGQSLRLRVWDGVSLEAVELSFAGVKHTFHGFYRRRPPQPELLELPGTALPEGRGELEITLRDRAGNTTSVSEVELLVDRTPPPRGRVQRPRSGERVSGVTEIELEGSDNLGPVTLELRASGSALAEVIGPRALVSVDTALFPRGPLTLELVPRDQAGNVGPTSSVNVVVE